MRYPGTQGRCGDTQALEVMSRAAGRAGFKDVRYELEPLAAAYEYETSIREEQKLLVVDVGGGTTDCVMMRVSPQKAGRANRDDDILGVSGDRVGGTDFDEALAWHALMAAFGKDTLRKNGFPVPHSLLYDAISIRNLPAQLRFAKSKREIADLIEQAVEPEKLARLATLQEQQLQYRLVHSAESAKIELSKTGDINVPLDYIQNALAIPVPPRPLGDASARPVDQCADHALEAVPPPRATPAHPPPRSGGGGGERGKGQKKERKKREREREREREERE